MSIYEGNGGGMGRSIYQSGGWQGVYKIRSEDDPSERGGASVYTR